MLVGAVNRGVHGHLPIDQSSSVGLREQQGHNRVPRTVATETSVTFPDGLPRTKRFRQIPPGNPRPIPINDAFQNAAVVLERTTRAILRGRHQRLEASPLTVRQHGSTRHGLSLSDRPGSIRRHALARCWIVRPTFMLLAILFAGQGRFCILVLVKNRAILSWPGQTGDMDLHDGGVISRCEFEEALSRTVAGQLRAITGSVPLDFVLRDVASSVPGSGARVDAIEVARFVFAQLDPTADDGMPWRGPLCPSCGTEMNAEIVITRNGLRGCECCPQCDFVFLLPDLFAV